MDDFINKMVDRTSHFLAEYPGLLPLFGVGLIILNLVLHIIFPASESWFVDSNPLLHLGLILSIIGILTIKPLG